MLSSAGAMAQADSPWETELDLESVTVVTPFADSDAPIDVEPVLGELSMTGTAERVLENGVRIRTRGTLRLQRDHTARAGGIGGFGTELGAPVGAFSGLSSAAPIETSDVRTRLETAYLQVDGGYGEVRVGKDQGVAARFYEGPRSVLSHARLDSTLLDPNGLSTVRTRHDLTGPSVKLSYATPRILGLRGGISYTPEGAADGLDRRPSAGTGVIAPELENAVEIAVNGTRRLRESGVRIDLGAAWSTADTSTRGGANIYGSVETWSAGTRLEKDDWTFGAAWLSSNNGRSNSDFTSWSAGLHKEAYNTDFSIEYGQSTDDGAGLDGESWRVGAARAFGRSTRLGVAFLNDTNDLTTQKWDTQGIVVEITLSQ